MEMGEIKEIGTHRELYEKSGYYRRLYDLQFERHPGEEVPLEEMADRVFLKLSTMRTFLILSLVLVPRRRTAGAG